MIIDEHQKLLELCSRINFVDDGILKKKKKYILDRLSVRYFFVYFH